MRISRFFRPLAGGLFIGLVAGGCQSELPADNDPADNDIEASAGSTATSNDSDRPLSPPKADREKPSEPDQQSPRSPRFVGRWAAEERLCATTSWRFTESELRTPAGSVCRFTNIEEVPGGYDIRARCTAEAPEREDLLQIRFAESARAMLFDSESIADAGLISCDPAG